MLINSARYCLPSSKGAVYAAQSPARNLARKLLLAMMAHAASSEVSAEQIAKWSGIPSATLATRLYNRMLTKDMIEEFSTPYLAGKPASAQALSEKLATICDSSMALLADQQGFCLASAGFPAHEIDRLAALCAELANIRLRQSDLSSQSLDIIGTWQCARLGSTENCQLQPLFIGQHHLTLLMSGNPRLDNRALADMVWMLVHRHGTTSP